MADVNGQVTFTSILPGCYSGRWTHIHFEVYPDIASIGDSAKAIATSQMAFPASVVNDVYALPAYPGSAQNLARITLATALFQKQRWSFQNDIFRAISTC